MEPKAGTKTTEFLALAACGAVVVASGLDAINPDKEHVVMFIALAGAYIGQRGWVKTSATNAAKPNSGGAE